MSFISSIGTSTWIALGAAGVGASIGAKVADDHGQSWALGALIGGSAGFAGARLVSFGVNRFNSTLMKDAATGAATLAKDAQLGSTGSTVLIGASRAGGGAATLAIASRATGGAATSIAGTTMADELFRAVMLNRSFGTGAATAATQAAVHSSTTVASMIAANVPHLAAAAPRIAAPVLDTAPRIVAPVLQLAAPQSGGGLVGILKAFVR